MNPGLFNRSFRQLRPFLTRYGILLWIVGVAAFTLLFALRQREELVKIRDLGASAHLGWLIGALAIQLCLMGLAGLVYQIVLRRLGHRLSWLRLVDIYLQRQLVGTVTPVGGPASLYVFLRALGQRGVPADDAVLGSVLRTLANTATFTLVLIPGLILTRPNWMVLVGAGGFVLFLSGLLAGFALVLQRPDRESPLLRHLPCRVAAFFDSARAHQLRALELMPPLGLGLIGHLLGITLLFACLRAIGQETSLLVPLIGYVVGNLFQMIAPVFQGLGLVEISMALALQQLGVPPAAAIAATLLLRLADVWLPLALGASTQLGRRVQPRAALERVPAIGFGAIGVAAIASAIQPFVVSGPSLPVSLPQSFRPVVLMAGDLPPVAAVWIGLCCLIAAYGFWHRRLMIRHATLGLFVALVPAIAVEQLQILVSSLPL